MHQVDLGPSREIAESPGTGLGMSKPLLPDIRLVMKFRFSCGMWRSGAPGSYRQHHFGFSAG